MPNYIVVLERIIEETILIEDVETDNDAVDLAVGGGGTLEDSQETWPTIVSVEQLPEEEELDPNVEVPTNPMVDQENQHAPG